MKFKKQINGHTFSGTFDKSQKLFSFTGPFPCQIKVCDSHRAEMHHDLTDQQAWVIKQNFEGVLLALFNIASK